VPKLQPAEQGAPPVFVSNGAEAGVGMRGMRSHHTQSLPCRGVSHFFGFFLGAAWVLNPLAADFVADGGRAGAAAEPAAWSGAADETAAETVELTGALPWTPV